MKLSVSIIKLLVISASLVFFTSCVSKKKYEEEVTRAAAEKAALEGQIAESQAANEKLQGEFDELERNLNMSKEEITKLSGEIKTQNGKIQGLQDAITEVFSTYNPDDITIEERSGKLYISMANKILFDAGRATLTKESEGLIDSLASVFNDNPDLDIHIEGHTDSDPVKIHRAKFKDNWQLSSARALTVVRMLEEGGVNGSRLTASGKGDTQPIASNDTDEGKETNRRTEFVIAPKIDGLYRMYKDGYPGMGTSN